MKSKIIWLVLTISVFIGASLGWLFHYKDSVSKEHITFNFFNEAPLAQAPKTTRDSWLDNARNFNKSYSYPAQEFEVFVDFMDPNIQAIPEKLFVAAVDSFLFSCLNELLKDRKVEFAYSKNSNVIDLVIYLPKEYTKAQNLIQELQYYEIPYTYQ